MANHELLPTQNLNCEVTTSDVSFDFGDTSRFRKIEFPEQAGLTANSLLQLLPAAAWLPGFIRSFLSHSSQHQFIQFERHLPDHIIIKCLGLDISKAQFLIQLFSRCVILDHIKSQCFLASFSFLFNYILY